MSEMKNKTLGQFKCFMGYKKIFLSAYGNLLLSYISIGPLKMNYCFKKKTQGFYK